MFLQPKLPTSLDFSYLSCYYPDMKNWLKITLFSLTVLLGSAGFATFVLSMTAPAPIPTVIAKPAIQDRPLLELINELRASKGIAPLTASPELNLSAQKKADDMAIQHYFDHVSPQGKHGYEYIREILPNRIRATENLTMCPDSNLRAFQNWSNSPAHYEGMIDPRVTLYGEATAWDDVKKCRIYVNHFAAV